MRPHRLRRDIVDWGVFPEETIALLRERRIPCIRGNHDRWAIGGGSAEDPSAESSAEPHDANGWDLSESAMSFLAMLPPAWNTTIDGIRVAAHHARPGSDMAGIYPDIATRAELCTWLDEANADVLVVGHTHIPFCIDVVSRGLVVNPGALLRDSAEPMSDAWLLDPATGKFERAPAPGTGTFGVLDVIDRMFRVHAASTGAHAAVLRRRVDTNV